MRTRCFNSLPPTAPQWASIQRALHFRSDRLSGPLNTVTAALAWLETNKSTLRSLFQCENGALRLFTYHPKVPKFLWCQAVYQPYHRWYHLVCQGEWLNNCWMYGILPPGRWIHWSCLRRVSGSRHAERSPSASSRACIISGGDATPLSKHTNNGVAVGKHAVMHDIDALRCQRGSYGDSELWHVCAGIMGLGLHWLVLERKQLLNQLGWRNQLK